MKVKLPAKVACKSMNRVQEQKHLAQANRHIAELAVQILRQRVIVKYALDTGQRSEMAESLLDALEGSLRMFERHRIFLLSCSTGRPSKGEHPSVPTGRRWPLPAATKAAASFDLRRIAT
jgi:N-acyl-D-aspartate/D-glutamate deacylase